MRRQRAGRESAGPVVMQVRVQALEAFAKSQFFTPEPCGMLERVVVSVLRLGSEREESVTRYPTHCTPPERRVRVDSKL
jgi:hypothetical protein